MPPARAHTHTRALRCQLKRATGSISSEIWILSGPFHQYLKSAFHLFAPRLPPLQRARKQQAAFLGPLAIHHFQGVSIFLRFLFLRIFQKGEKTKWGGRRVVPGPLLILSLCPGVYVRCSCLAGTFCFLLFLVFIRACSPNDAQIAWKKKRGGGTCDRADSSVAGLFGPGIERQRERKLRCLVGG